MDRAYFRVALAALLLTAAASAAAEPPARLLYHGHIFTADPAAPYAEAIAIAGDRIIAVGALAEVAAAAGPQAERIDLQGRFLMPGMLDAHAHPIWGGLALTLANYPDTQVSMPHLKAFIDPLLAGGDSRFGDVLMIYNVDIGHWTHTDDLNALLSRPPYDAQPIVLVGADGHTAWGNRTAMAHAGITPAHIKALSLADRRFYGFDRQFQSNGFVVDAGLTWLTRHLPKPSPATLMTASRAAIAYLHSVGITGWLDAQAAGPVGGDIPADLDEPGFLPTYLALSQAGELSAHVVAYPVILPDGGSQQIAVVKAFRDRYQRPPDLLLPGLKVFADGVVEVPSQTAALTKPYLGGRQPPLLFTPSRFAALVSEADRGGLAVHVHAIGNLAVKATLDAFAAMRRANGPSPWPHTITHAQFVDAEDIPRFAGLDVIAALQLYWAVADPSTDAVVKPFIDASIYDTMYPARSLLEAGTVIAGASDWPVTSANPFLAIYQAETRSGPEGVLAPAGEVMPRQAMLLAYTINAARVLGHQDRLGSLRPGKQADLALIDRDVLTVPAEQMRDSKVLWTMVGGRVVYHAE